MKVKFEFSFWLELWLFLSFFSQFYDQIICGFRLVARSCLGIG